MLDVKIDRRTNTLIREGVPSIVNPVDLNALEEALRLREAHGGKATALSMGPTQAKEALRKAISLGVDEAILLSDPLFAGSDTLATSYVLAQAIRRIWRAEGLDIVLCGKQAMDGDTGQVPPGIATRLSLPQLTYVERIASFKPESREIEVERRLDDWRETTRARLPALVSVLPGINDPRRASVKAMIRAARYQVPVWGRAAIEADPGKVGLAGSPTRVSMISTPPQRVGGEVMQADKERVEEVAAALVERLMPTLLGWRERISQ